MSTSRVTRTEVETTFAMFCERVGVPVGGTFDPATRTMSRGYALDYASCYGGWVIVSYDGDGTGEGRPFGSMRQPARSFVASLRFAISALAISART